MTDKTADELKRSLSNAALAEAIYQRVGAEKGLALIKEITLTVQETLSDLEGIAGKYGLPVGEVVAIALAPAVRDVIATAEAMNTKGGALM